MTKTVRLHDLQLVLLSNAAARDNGSLVPLPMQCAQDGDRISKAVTGLLRRSFVEEMPVIARSLCWREQDHAMIGLFITKAGRAAIRANDSESYGRTTATDLAESDQVSSPRATNKSATVLALLEREHGATLDDLIEATGWLPHTTRAALTTLRKKGHELMSTKVDGGRRYRVAVAPTQAAGAQ